MTVVMLQPSGLTSAQQSDYNEVRAEALTLIDNPDFWLATPHPLLSAKTPIDLIVEDRKQIILDLLNLIRQGTFT